MKQTLDLDREVWTVSDVAAHLRVHFSTVYRMIERDEIPRFKIGSDHRFLRSEIQRWEREQTEQRSVTPHTSRCVPTRKSPGRPRKVAAIAGPGEERTLADLYEKK